MSGIDPTYYCSRSGFLFTALCKTNFRIMICKTKFYFQFASSRIYFFN